MKKYFYSFALFLFTFLTLHAQSFAASGEITRQDAFIFFAAEKKDIPESFQYIRLNFLDIQKDSPLEDALQKLIYSNAIKNINGKLYPTHTLSQYEFYAIAQSIFKIKSPIIADASTHTPATNADFEVVKSLIPISNSGIVNIQINGARTNTVGLTQKEKIFFDVYETLQNEHYNAESFSEEKLMNGAITGLVEETGDKYTTYFPPVESDGFFENLSGEYEGIGAYVEMPSPGKLIIISPIVGGPAEAAGLQGGDQITHIDDKIITEKNTLSEVVSWIKGPAESSVKLTVLREGNPTAFPLSVIRKKITINDIEYKRLDSSTFYIQLKNFGESSGKDFNEALNELVQYPQIKKIIIDVRNNPGGYLDQVSDILSYFVPKGEATAIVSSGKKDTKYISRGYELLDPSKYNIVILQNGGSASASEILAGTLKDYYPDIAIIGEKSFGKGSVQSLKSYYDGSTLKFTSAKWYTGKTRIGIDGTGVPADKVIELDNELLKKSQIDTQLQAARYY